MGIQDRDYMRRPPDDDDDDASGSVSESEAAERLNGLLQRKGKFFRYAALAVGALVVIAVILALISEKKR